MKRQKGRLQNRTFGLLEALAKLPSRDITGTRPLVPVQAAIPVSDNIVVLTATSGDQLSAYDPNGQPDLLTYFLLKGLKGEADIDGDSRHLPRTLQLVQGAPRGVDVGGNGRFLEDRIGAGAQIRALAEGGGVLSRQPRERV